MPKVYNKYHKDAPKDAVFIGRPTKWGNLYSHLPNTTAKFKVKTREEAVALYEHDLLNGKFILTPEDVKLHLKGKDLVCYCAPKACHGDILLRIANEN